LEELQRGQRRQQQGGEGFQERVCFMADVF